MKKNSSFFFFFFFTLTFASKFMFQQFKAKAQKNLRLLTKNNVLFFCLQINNNYTNSYSIKKRLFCKVERLNKNGRKSRIFFELY